MEILMILDGLGSKKQSQSAWGAEPAQAIPKACGFEAATRRRKSAI